MTKTKQVKVNYGEIAKEWTVVASYPKGFRWWTFKIRIAFLLIRLGTWIANMGFSITDVEQEGQE